MELVLTTRLPISISRSGVLTATSDGELLSDTQYDRDDSLTTGYIVFTNNIADAVWQRALLRRVTARLISNAEPLDVPSFALVFTNLLNLELTKGDPIVIPSPMATTDLFGYAKFEKTQFQKIVGNFYEQSVVVDFAIPLVVGRDFYSFAIVKDVGSFSNNTILDFELIFERT